MKSTVEYFFNGRLNLYLELFVTLLPLKPALLVAAHYVSACMHCLACKYKSLAVARYECLMQ